MNNTPYRAEEFSEIERLKTENVKHKASIVVLDKSNEELRARVLFLSAPQKEKRLEVLREAQDRRRGFLALTYVGIFLGSLTAFSLSASPASGLWLFSLPVVVPTALHSLLALHRFLARVGIDTE